MQNLSLLAFESECNFHVYPTSWCRPTHLFLLRFQNKELQPMELCFVDCYDTVLSLSTFGGTGRYSSSGWGIFSCSHRERIWRTHSRHGSSTSQSSWQYSGHILKPALLDLSSFFPYCALLLLHILSIADSYMQYFFARRQTKRNLVPLFRLQFRFILSKQIFCTWMNFVIGSAYYSPSEK